MLAPCVFTAQKSLPAHKHMHSQCTRRHTDAHADIRIRHTDTHRHPHTYTEAHGHSETHTRGPTQTRVCPLLCPPVCSRVCPLLFPPVCSFRPCFSSVPCHLLLWGQGQPIKGSHELDSLPLPSILWGPPPMPLDPDGRGPFLGREEADVGRRRQNT